MTWEATCTGQFEWHITKPMRAQNFSLSQWEPSFHWLAFHFDQGCVAFVHRYAPRSCHCLSIPMCLSSDPFIEMETYILIRSKLWHLMPFMWMPCLAALQNAYTHSLGMMLSLYTCCSRNYKCVCAHLRTKRNSSDYFRTKHLILLSLLSL